MLEEYDVMMILYDITMTKPILYQPLFVCLNVNVGTFIQSTQNNRPTPIADNNSEQV